jgi:hypothetical protein
VEGRTKQARGRGFRGPFDKLRLTLKVGFGKIAGQTVIGPDGRDGVSPSSNATWAWGPSQQKKLLDQLAQSLLEAGRPEGEPDRRGAFDLRWARCACAWCARRQSDQAITNSGRMRFKAGFSAHVVPGGRAIPVRDGEFSRAEYALR